MGFVTKSSMMVDYVELLTMSLDFLDLIVYYTPDGILLEVVEEEMDSHSINQEVKGSQIIKFNRTDIKLEDFTVEEFEHKEGWEDEE